MPIEDKSNILWSTLFLLLVSLVVGCVTTSDQGIISDAPLDQEGIVFGTLSACDCSIYYGAKVDAFNPYPKSLVLKGDALSSVFFAQRLPTGDYHINGLSVGNRRANLTARFTVASNKATYIGSLQVAFRRGEPGILGGPTTRVAMGVTNELDKALQQYKQRNPRLPYEIATNLVTFGG